MRKTLIALAVGSAFAAPVAKAEVTLSGAITAGPTYLHSGDGSSGASNSIVTTPTTGTKGTSVTGIDTNYSNITISSLEDLGGGLKLDFAFQIIAPIQGNLPLQNRNSHIGLTSDTWGGVWVGTNEQLYERYMYSVDPLDGAAGVGGNLQLLGTPGYGSVFSQATTGNVYSQFTGNMIGNAEFYNRTEGAIWYDSPNWNGFTFGVYTTLSQYKSNGNAVVTGQNPQVMGGGAKYVSPQIPIQVWAAYERHKDMYGLNVITSAGGTGVTPPTGTSSSDHGLQLGVGYTIGDIFAYVNFEQLKYEVDGLGGAAVNEYKRNAFSLAGKWNVPTGYVGAQFIMAMNATCGLANGNSCNADNTGAKMIGLGYYHTLSKQTQAYVMGTYIHNDSLQSYTIAGGGDQAGPGLPVNLGSNQYGVIVGLKHTF